MSYYIAIEDGPAFSTNPAPADTPFTVTFTLRNTGDAPATVSDDPFQQGFYVGYRFTNGNGRVVEENALFVAALGPDERSNQTFDTSFSSRETFTVTLLADPAESVGGVVGNGLGDQASAFITIS